MRLLKIHGQDEISLTKDLSNDIPIYAILSHTWAQDNDEEVTFADLATFKARDKPGYKKIKFCAEQSKRDGIDYCWVDTCCIDKTNHVELSEAITSMFRWYQHAEKCYVYLSDVSVPPGGQDGTVEEAWRSTFRHSRWFTRGWTLQELLAPNQVIFYSREGTRLGTKRELENLLHDITGIPITALNGRSLFSFSIEERMRWTRGRTTKKAEDQAYCLLGIFGVYIPLIYGEGDNAFVRLTKELNDAPKAKLSLRVAEGAEFDAYDQTHRACHPATRVDLLQNVRDWAHDPDAKNIFWLNGMAGTGKSTISWTITKWLTELGSGGPVSLGASFFFKRLEGERSSASLLFPTLASQLAVRIRHFDTFVAQAVNAHPQICNKSLGEQFDKLIYRPLRNLPFDTDHSTYVIVIDALDECDNETDIRSVLQLWPTLNSVIGKRIRLFLTSRPELVLRLGFKKMATAQYQGLVLHQIPQSVVQHDICAFLTDALAEIRNDYNLEAEEDELAADWPGSQCLHDLTHIAVPLFIVAATISRFIQDAIQPQDGLNAVLHSGRGGRMFGTAQMYGVVLRAMSASSRSIESDKLHLDFRTIVGAIVCLGESVSRTALATLLKVSASDIRVLLQPLHAVLQVPLSSEGLIRPLHLSFTEYLLSDEAQAEPYGINSTATHVMLWQNCLQLLSSQDGLRENICNLSYPGQLRNEIKSDILASYLPPAVKYACRYWVFHLRAGEYALHDGDIVHTFLQQHFLHWLEALSLLGRLAEVFGFLQLLRQHVAVSSIPQHMHIRSCMLTLVECQPDDSDQITAFLEDAGRFLLANRYVAELAPLQLYSSALAFAPQNSVLRNKCSGIAPWIQQVPITQPNWSSELQVLEGHTDNVSAVTFSPDGLLLASASQDGTVRLWQASTGQEIQTFEGYSKDSATVLAFSPNGTLLALSQPDGVLQLRQAATGQETKLLVGHCGYVTAMVFSPDGSQLASASTDETLRIWNVNTGDEVKHRKSYTGHVPTMSFSPNGSLMAFVSELGFRPPLIILWQVETAQIVQTLEDETDHITVLAFSLDGSLLTSISGRGTLRQWQVSTGHQVQHQKLHKIYSLADTLSPDGSLLVSASHFAPDRQNHVLRVRQVTTAQVVQELIGHTERINAVAFSPDGSLFASASHDKTVRLWQTNVQALKHHREIVFDTIIPPIEKVVFSPDGSLLASRGRRGRIVRLWNVSTGLEIRRLSGHKSDLNLIKFSPDSSLLVTTSNWGSLRLWDAKTGQILYQLDRSFENDSTHVTEVTFTPNSLSVMIATVDETVRVLRLSAPEAGTFRNNDIEVPPATSMNNDTVITETIYSSQKTYSIDVLPIHDTNSFRYGPSDYCSKGDWVEFRGQRLLWLPQEYRTEHGRAEATATYENTVAIGCIDGVVRFLRLKYE